MKHVLKRADRVTVKLDGPRYSAGAHISLIGARGRGYYLRVEIPIPPSHPGAKVAVAWCEGRTMRAFIKEAHRRLGSKVRAERSGR